MTTKVTREQAACILFCEEITENNMSKLTKQIDSMKDIEICYEKDPLKPMLLPTVRINSNPFCYLRYLCNTSKLESKIKDKNCQGVQFTSESQIIQFLNEVYLPSNPYNDEVYEFKHVTIKEILSLIWKYTAIFDDKSISSLASWCSARKIHFTTIHTSRKLIKNDNKERVRYRELYVIKDKFIDGIAKGIIEYIPRFQQYILNLKSNEYQIIGYVRKLHGKEDKESRIRLLQCMADKLLTRMSVDKVYASPMSHANEPLVSRDVNYDKEILKGLKNIEGNTQDLLSYIRIAKKVCLVAIDFAGITTNIADLRNFVRDNDSVKKILIDSTPYGKYINIYDRDQLLDSSQELNEFNCRQQCLQRSK
ncbi:hypothetical protein BJ944DRAFT_11032 [Cunninghamella echinulata]|nr:hypothetical protein BJ944DRAFT_11032 [Cunninghamella echinulata]